MVSRYFPGGYNVKLYICRGRLAWWLLAFCTVRISLVAGDNSILKVMLTLKVLVTTIDAQWEGMGYVESARYKPALLPQMPDHKGSKLQ